MGRVPACAYINKRIIALYQHEDCYELKTRSDYNGRTFEHTAVVYQSGDGWFAMINTNLKEDVADIRTYIAAFASFDKALRGGLEHVAKAQGWMHG